MNTFDLSDDDWEEFWRDVALEQAARRKEGYHELLRGQRVQLENSSVWLIAHSPDACLSTPYCSLHNRSDHHMRSWTQHWRGDRGIMERICPDNGIGHPDPDDFKCRTDPTGAEWIHGCDGCCSGPFSHEMAYRWKTYSSERREAERKEREEQDREDEADAIAAMEDEGYFV